MKTKLFLGLILLATNYSFAQADLKKRPAIGIAFFVNDFKLLKPKAGIAFSYLKGLHNYIDIECTLSTSFLDYPLKGRYPFFDKTALVQLSTTTKFKLFTDQNWITPLAVAGVEASKYKSYYGFSIPFGLGLQANYKREIFFLYNSSLVLSVSNNAESHFRHSIGIAGNIGKKRSTSKKKIPIPQVPIETKKTLDSDGDGILDIDDACPAVPGLAVFKGCPDKDGDGVPDNNDKCPEIPGITRYFGCPIPDSDKDGINDEEDSCVSVFGFKRYNGCPIPDSDGDLVNDEIDRCPTVPGTVKNLGCPEVSDTINTVIERAAAKIFFKTGSDELLAVSFKPLNEVAKILITNKKYQLQIEGHTDNVGTPQSNKLLSEKRAGRVFQYLSDQGISMQRMTALGYGQEKPIADNSTKSGRSKNRRVELKITTF